MRKCNSLIYVYQGNDKLNKDVSVLYQAPLKPHPHGVLYTKIILEVITICSLWGNSLEGSSTQSRNQLASGGSG